MSAAVRLDDLTLSYERQPAVHHVSGAFEPGSLTAITGPNGAGKSTLLKGIAGLITTPEGGIVTQGSLAYLPQTSDVQSDFPLTVLQMVCTGLWNRTGVCRAITPQHRTQALDALKTVGLGDFAGRQTGSLSAGQFQRAMFARLLLQDARIILLDEPFAAVDADTTRRLIDLMTQWHKEGRTILCVLHDLEQIRSVFPQCLLMARKCIAWGRTAEVLTSQNLTAARFFHEGWPHSEEEACAQ